MLQQGEEAPTGAHYTYQYKMQELLRGGRKKSKTAVFKEPDPAQEHAKQDKQESPKIATATCIH